MSENQPAQPDLSQAPVQDAEPKSFDAEYVAKLRRENAKYRTEAQQNAAAVAELETLKQSQMTEADKTSARIKALEDSVAQQTARALRYQVAAAHGISNEDADLFLTGSDEETITTQAARLAARTPSQPTTPKPDLTQGGTGAPLPSLSDGLEEALRSKLGIA